MFFISRVLFMPTFIVAVIPLNSNGNGILLSSSINVSPHQAINWKHSLFACVLFSLWVALLVDSIYFIFRCRCLQIAEFRMYYFWWAHSLFSVNISWKSKCENWYFSPVFVRFTHNSRTRNIKRTRQLQWIAATAERSFIFIFIRALDARFVTNSRPRSLVCLCMCAVAVWGRGKLEAKLHTAAICQMLLFFSFRCTHCIHHISLSYSRYICTLNGVIHAVHNVFLRFVSKTRERLARASVCVTHAQSLECLSHRPQIAIQ